MNDFNLANSTDSTAVATVTENVDGNSMILDLTTRQTSYCSMLAETKEEKAALYNMMNNPEKRLADCINMQIAIKHVYVEAVTCTNKESGEKSLCPRIVFLDDSGVSYSCVSIGIFNALKKLFQVYGEPTTWNGEPLTVEVKQISKGERKMLTLNVV